MRETVTGPELDPITSPDTLQLDQELDAKYGGAFEALDTPKWVLAADAFPELKEAARVETIRFLGSIAIRGETERPPEKDTGNGSTLMAASQAAALGDEQGLRVVHNNVATDVAERLFKAGHQTKIYMHMALGHLEQEGRRLTDIHRSNLEYSVLNGEMLRRSKTELQNAVLFGWLHRANVLDHYDAAVFSTSSTTMSAEEKQAYGMFADTESCSIQYLAANGNDVTLETAFVAGKTTPDGERHDIKAIKALAEMKGAPINTTDGTDMLQHVILIPKGETRGVADVVEWYDDAAGGTFYGQDKPRQNYHDYAETCYRRSEDFEGMVQAIVGQLVSESHTFKTPLEAVMRLDELSALYSRERALHDTSIDVAVFGREAAGHIQDARFFRERGQHDRVDTAMAEAAATDQSGACPLFKGSSTTEGGSGQSGPGGQEDVGGKKWGHCPYCKAEVFVDPCAKRISCWDCTALVVNGKIISKGNGGSRKRGPSAADHIEELINNVFKERGIESFEQEAGRAETAVAAGSLALAKV